MLCSSGGCTMTQSGQPPPRYLQRMGRQQWLWLALSSRAQSGFQKVQDVVMLPSHVHGLHQNSTCAVPASSQLCHICVPSSVLVCPAQGNVAALLLWRRSSNTAFKVSALLSIACRAHAAELMLQLYPGCLCHCRSPCCASCQAFQPAGVRSPAQRPPLLPPAPAQHAAAEPAADRGQYW